MTEIFEALAVVGDAVTEEDCVVYLLASLPPSYDMLVTALEAQSECVPKWKLVTERLRHEELKQKEETPATDSGRKLFFAKQKREPKKQFTCHFCHKPGHFKRDCRKFLASKTHNHGASLVEVKESPAAEETMAHTLATGSDSKSGWTVDSGATCHMSKNKAEFVDLQTLPSPLEVTLSDGHTLEATVEGTVLLETSSVARRKHKRLQIEECFAGPKALLQTAKRIQSLHCWEKYKV